MNKVLFTTFVVMLSLGITLYIHQDSNAVSKTDTSTSADGKVVASAYAGCGSNSATATLSISYVDWDDKQDGDSYAGEGYCKATAGWNTRRDPEEKGNKQFWLKAKQKSFLWYTWISVDTQSVSAYISLDIGQKPDDGPSVSTHAIADGTFHNADQQADDDGDLFAECSTS